MVNSLLLKIALSFSITYIFICSKMLNVNWSNPRDPSPFEELHERTKELVIDLVITYVNGSDKQFQHDLEEARSSYAENKLPPFSANRNRFTDNDDMRFLLRSVEIYGEIFRKIFLVVADETQVPSWLDVGAQSGRLEIVYHRDIWHDQSQLPNFNSLAIEANLHHIEGLAEHYVYANDDVAFLAPVVVEDFFQANELGQLMSFTARPSSNPAPSKPYARTAKEAHYVNPVINSLALLQSEQVCRLPTFKDMKKMPQHSVHAFIKSVLEHAEEIPLVREAFEKTWASKFRSGVEINVVHFFENYARCGLKINATVGKDNDIVFLHLGEPILTLQEYEVAVGNLVTKAGLILRSNPSARRKLKYLCVNDDTPDEEAVGSRQQNFSQSYSNVVRVWRRMLFSAKSNFETRLRQKTANGVL